MKYQIRGTTLQVLDMELDSGESVYTESGGMAWMSPNIDMKTSTRGGLMKGLGRMFAGESLFMTTYTANTGTASISFANEFPGKIIPLDLSDGKTIIAQKDSFLCAEESVQISMHFRKKLGTGFFGGEGFILQKIEGQGNAFLEVAGEVTEYTLKEDQILKVDPGHIAFFESSIHYEITTVKGLKNILFSGEGLFLATLQGPGKVWLQSMPLSNFAAKIMSKVRVK